MPMNFRTLSNLLLGLMRIYKRQLTLVSGVCTV